MTKELNQNYETLNEKQLDEKYKVRLIKNSDTDVSYVDIRCYYKGKPTKKGVRLHQALFNKLKLIEF
jgi:hypothetical protein